MIETTTYVVKHPMLAAVQVLLDGGPRNVRIPVRREGPGIGTVELTDDQFLSLHPAHAPHVMSQIEYNARMAGALARAKAAAAHG